VYRVSTKKKDRPGVTTKEKEKKTLDATTKARGDKMGSEWDNLIERPSREKWLGKIPSRNERAPREGKLEKLPGEGLDTFHEVNQWAGGSL